jgi:hypothetical protein
VVLAGGVCTDQDREGGVGDPPARGTALGEPVQAVLFAYQDESPVLEIAPARCESPGVEDITLDIAVDRFDTVGTPSMRVSMASETSIRVRKARTACRSGPDVTAVPDSQFQCRKWPPNGYERAPRNSTE